MKKLAAPNKDVLVALLRERLSAARIAVLLYDRLLEARDALHVPEKEEVLDALEGLRSQEDEHAVLLHDLLDQLGETSLAIPARHLRGFEDVARAPDARVSEIVPALWALECTQDVAWDLLVRLARGAEDPEAVIILERRAREAHAHSVLLRDIIQSALRQRMSAAPRRVAA